MWAILKFNYKMSMDSKHIMLRNSSSVILRKSTKEAYKFIKPKPVPVENQYY
jgi:hypothetical protein